jgi:TrmH family RNA methyltransferase
MDRVTAITSRDNPLLVKLRRLAQDPAAYRRAGEIWLEGDHLCSAFAQHGGVASQAVITEAAWAVADWRKLAGRAARVAVVPPMLMASLSTLESPPALGFVVPWPGPGTLEPGLASVVLDRLQDAGNVGSILRSASAFGFKQVIALKGTAGLWSPKVLRAAMGAHFGLRLVESGSAADLDALAVPLVATSSHASQALHEVRLPPLCAWLFGHEGQGLAAELARRCALTLAIPQPGGEESLNVASAAAVCMYESCRQGLPTTSRREPA